MGAKRPAYTREFRQRAVELWRGWDGTQDDLAAHMGMCSRTLRRWLRRAEADEAVTAARTSGTVPLRDLEVRRLEREIAQLKQANSALQDSVRFLAARRRR